MNGLLLIEIIKHVPILNEYIYEVILYCKYNHYSSKNTRIR